MASAGKRLAAVKAALASKERGNAAFKQKSNEEAIGHYQAGLQELASSFYPGQLAKHTGAGSSVDASTKHLFAVLYSNCAAAFLSIGDNKSALHEATEAVRFEPGWSKAHARRAKALFSLKKYKLSATAYAHALECAGRERTACAAKHATELEAVKAQAASQADAFIAMMEENQKLKRQLDDYNLMFDNMAKKGV